VPKNKESMKLEHIGIAVNSLGSSDDLFERLLGKKNYKQESVEREGVTTSFYEVGDSKIELLEASSAESPIAKFLDKKGEGIHHLAFGVEDIFTEIQRLKNEGSHRLEISLTSLHVQGVGETSKF
jgi:methylmalonyl-CoA/ethylmalonyl-CoA epimerase